MFWKYAANLQENTHAEVWFQPHFGMSVLLYIWCIISEHLVLGTLWVAASEILSWVILTFIRSRPEVFCKKGILTTFTKFTGKLLWQSLIFNKVAGLTTATLLKKRHWRRCLLVNFVKFPRTPFLKEHLYGCFCTLEFWR